MKHIFTLAISLFMLVSCQNELKGGDDVQMHNEVKVCRFEQMVRDYVALNNVTTLQKMNTEYPQETKLLVEDVLELGYVDDPDIYAKLRSFSRDSTVRKLWSDVQTRYPDMKSEEKQFSVAFNRLRKDFPELVLPRIYTQMSAFKQSIVLGDSAIGISLDKYLGEDYPLYKTYYYNYQLRSMKRERIVPDALAAYLNNVFPLPADSSHVLMERVLHIGKINWSIANVLGIPLDNIIGFSQKQAQWCTANKMRIHIYLNELRAWEATDPLLYRAVMLPADNTPALGKESSDAVGLWYGIHVIDAYMKIHPKTTGAQLMLNNDYRRIYAESGFIK